MKYYNPNTGQTAQIDDTKPKTKNTVYVFYGDHRGNMDNVSVKVDWDKFIQAFYEAIK